MLVNILVGGSFSGATGILNSLYGLSREDGAIDALRAELTNLPNVWTLEALHSSHCPCLNAAMLESLRWRSPVPAYFKDVLVPTSLGGALTVPSGCKALLTNRRDHNDRAYWGEDAPEFRSARWKGTSRGSPQTRCSARRLALLRILSSSTKLTRRAFCAGSKRTCQTEVVTISGRLGVVRVDAWAQSYIYLSTKLRSQLERFVTLRGEASTRRRRTCMVAGGPTPSRWRQWSRFRACHPSHSSSGPRS